MNESIDDYEHLKLKTYDHWTLYLHDKQNYLGRCYIALNRKGSLDPFSDTTSQERDELGNIVAHVHKALAALYQPDIYNYANFRNVWPHCHCISFHAMRVDAWFMVVIL